MWDQAIAGPSLQIAQLHRKGRLLRSHGTHHAYRSHKVEPFSVYLTRFVRSVDIFLPQKHRMIFFWPSPKNTATSVDMRKIYNFCHIHLENFSWNMKN